MLHLKLNYKKGLALTILKVMFTHYCTLWFTDLEMKFGTYFSKIAIVVASILYTFYYYQDEFLLQYVGLLYNSLMFYQKKSPYEKFDCKS